MRLLVCAILLSCGARAQNASLEQLFRSAVEAQQQGDFTTAVQEYRQLLQIQPDLPDARANLGAALVHLGRFDEAITEYRAALKSDPNNSAIRLNLALAYYKKGDYQPSAAELTAIHGSQPNDTRVATLLADCYSKLGDDARAVATLAQIQPTHPGDLDMAFVFGSALTRTGKAAEGAALLERVGKQGNSADAYLLAGSTLLKLNEKSRALGDLEAAMRLNPDLPGLLTQLAIAEEGSGDNARAENDLRKALAANPNDFEAAIHLGGILYTRRDLDQARIYIQRALQLQPSATFAIYEMALLEGADGHVDAAVADLEKVVKADPNWLDAHVQLAALYYKSHRPADGLRERQIVERLTAEQQRQGPGQNLPR
jgi:tetratricopeptide (TPR) repeat protein